MIGSSIDTFTELPKEVDVLRFLFGQSSKLTDANKITAIVKEIEKKYRERGFRIKGTEMIRLKTKRLLKSCKDLVAKRKNMS